MSPPQEPPKKDSLDRYLSRTASEEMRGGLASDVSVHLLKETRPWVLVIGVVLFVIGALIATFSIIVIVFAPDDGHAQKVGSGIVGVLTSGLYGYPGVKLIRYGRRIAKLDKSRTIADLHGALEEQKAFWVYAGITTLIVVGVYLALFVVVMITRINESH